MALIKKQIKVVQHSPLFDRNWYLSVYPDVKRNGVDPAYHYTVYGWREGRDPSKWFSTDEYFLLNPDVRTAEMCPLYHYEKCGRAEGRRYRLGADLEASTWRNHFRDFVASIKKTVVNYPKKVHYKMLPINPQKVLFATYQHQYVCNPKYICEELLHRKIPCEIVWLCNGGAEKSLMEGEGQSVRFVKYGTPEAAEEIATSKVLIENGLLLFNQTLCKKKNQVNICTWHGSLGFKRIGKDTVKSKRGLYVAEMYGKVHDAVLSNSGFENGVFRKSFWPHSELWELGHPRNDILFQKDPEVIRQIRENVRRKLHVPAGYKFALYAPTFRENPYGGPINNGKNDCYEMDYQILRKALEKRFDGNWIILVRHHYCNAQNKVLLNMITAGAVSATDYEDIQELMVASDVGITDYSSWILDFMLTGKPGFLFAADEAIYSTERGFYYPLDEAPFPVSRNMYQLKEQIESFDQEEYQRKVNAFLKDKACIEDGEASKRVVDRIEKILRKG